MRALPVGCDRTFKKRIKATAKATTPVTIANVIHIVISSTSRNVSSKNTKIAKGLYSEPFAISVTIMVERDYQLAFVTPGILPSRASSRNFTRQRPNLR